MKNQQQEVLEACKQWLGAGHQVDLVTVLRTWGSSPRPPGSLAAVRDDGVLVGSVSGGCVEKQLSEQFRTRELPMLHTYHIDNEQAKRYGLACGGQLDLLFERVAPDDQTITAVLSALASRERVSRRLNTGTQQVSVQPAGRNECFDWDGRLLTQVFGASYRLLIVGAGELSRYTAQFATALDFEVLVVDPREHFRQAWTDQHCVLLADSPDDAVIRYATDAHSAVLALSHDPNIDDLALMEALPSDAFYVGALGSVKNQEKRRLRLAGLDVDAQAIDRLKGPVGLSLGGRSSAEIAVSIAAELVQERARLI